MNHAAPQPAANNGAPAVVLAARASLERLEPDDPLRTKMQRLLDSAEPQLQKPRASRGKRPTLTEASINRRDLLERLKKTEPRWALRSDAFAAIDALLEAGWPPMSSTERTGKQRSASSGQKRKRGLLGADVGTVRAEMAQVWQAVKSLPQTTLSQDGDPIARAIGRALDAMDRELSETNTVSFDQVSHFLSNDDRWAYLGRLPAASTRRPGREAAIAAWDRLVAIAWPTDDCRCIEHRVNAAKIPDGQPPVPPPLPMLEGLTDRVNCPLQNTLPMLPRSRKLQPADNDYADADAWCCDIRHAGCIKPQCDSPEPTHAYMVWNCEECDWCACQACCAVGAHALCKHSLELIDQDGEFVCKESSSEAGVYIFEE